MVTVAVLQPMTKCSLFEKIPSLLVSPHHILSPVSLSICHEFIFALERNVIKNTDANFTEPQHLWKESGFSEFAPKLSEFCPSMECTKAEVEAEVEVKDADAGTRGQIVALEEKAHSTSLRCFDVVMFPNKVTPLSTDFVRPVDEVSALRSAAAGIQTLSEEFSALKTRIA
jgi:hypothetical protein